MRRSCYYYILLFSFGFMLFAFSSEAQQLKLGNNPTFINPAAVLQLDSKNQGLLLTRVPDTVVINALSPPDGMIIYFTDSSAISPYGPNAGVYERKNGKWQRLLYAGDGSIGIVSLNGSIVPAQTFATGTSGTDFNISTNAATGVHTFNLPDASATVRGLVNTGTQTFGGAKTFANTLTLGKDLFTSGSPGSDGQVLRSSGAGTSPRWENMLLDSLYNVKISSPSNGQVLQYNGTSWVNSSNTGNFWSLTGNAGTNSSSNFLGTTDYAPIVFRVNNQQVGYFGTTSGGSSNIAFGLNASAGYQSIAFGYSSTNTSNQTITLGYNSSSNSYQSIAIGAGAQTNGSTNGTIAIGTGASASGYQGIAIGASSSATSNNNVIALGVSASASGQNSTAIGYKASAPNPNTIILGNGANVGINTSSPTNTLTVNSGTSGSSGLQFTQMNSTSPPTVDSALLGIDKSGNVVVARGSSIPSVVTRTIGTPYQVSITRNAMVNYTIMLSVSPTVLSSASAEADLQISPNGTSGWTTVARVNLTINLGLLITQTQTSILSGFVPKGYYAKITSIASNATVTYITGQEMTLP